MLKLIPEWNRQVDTFRSALRDFGSIDYLLVLLEAGETAEAGALEEYADVFAERLAERTELVESVEYRFQPDAQFLELFTRNALLFLTPEELPQIGAKLTDEEIRAQIGNNRLALASPAADGGPCPSCGSTVAFAVSRVIAPKDAATPWRKP